MLWEGFMVAEQKFWHALHLNTPYPPLHRDMKLPWLPLKFVTAQAGYNTKMNSLKAKTILKALDHGVARHFGNKENGNEKTGGNRVSRWNGEQGTPKWRILCQRMFFIKLYTIQLSIKFFKWETVLHKSCKKNSSCQSMEERIRATRSRDTSGYGRLKQPPCHPVIKALHLITKAWI